MAKEKTLPPDVNPDYEGPMNGSAVATDEPKTRTRLINRNAYVKAMAEICDILAAFDPTTAKSILASAGQALELEGQKLY